MTSLAPTSVLSKGWSRQHEVSPTWAQGYWDSSDRPHRDVILRALELLTPFESVLELGCNTGPNLKRIHDRWPRVELTGIDVNREALEFGREAAHRAGWHWTGLEGSLTTITEFPSADVVLSCYSLCYLDPRDIDLVLQRALACARLGLVIAEPMSLGNESYVSGGIPEYHYNYIQRVKGRLVKTLLIRPPEQRLQHVMVFRKPDNPQPGTTSQEGTSQ